MDEKIFEQLVSDLKDRAESLRTYIPTVVLLPADSDRNRYIKRFKNWAIIYINIADKSEGEIINDLVMGIIVSNRVPKSGKINLHVKLVQVCSKILSDLKAEHVRGSFQVSNIKSMNGNAA